MLNRLAFAVAVGLVTMLAHVCPAAVVHKDILKQYFETGDKPTQSQFENLIDSTLTLELDFGATIDDHRLGLNVGGIATSTGWAIGHEHGVPIGPGLTYTPQAGVGAGSGWPGSSGFIGVQFELDNPGALPTTHYGYLQLSVDAATSPTPYTIRLVGFAYETDPDTPITTANIPEPAAVGLMIVACVGLLGHRNPRNPRNPPVKPGANGRAVYCH